RQVLGAPRLRLVHQLLVESGMLALAGAGLGVLLALIGTRALVRFAPSALQPQLGAATIDLRVLGFALLVAIVTAIFVGVWPALRATGPRMSPSLRGAGRAITGAAHVVRARRLLVIAETALSLVLLV